MPAPIGPEQRPALVEALGDSPETLIPVHLLRRGWCDAWVAGDPSDFRGAIVQAHDLMEEPWGFGDDAEVLWQLLGNVQGWKHVNVSQACAAPMGKLIGTLPGSDVGFHGDVYHIMLGPCPSHSNAAVRRLAPDDLPLLEAAPAAVRGGGGSTERMLEEGISAGAIDAGRLVAIASVSFTTDRHADIGVSTLEEWRGRGLATAAASLVAQAVQESGRAPVWSAGEGNAASLRVAQKLGFVEVSRRVYINLHKRR